MPLRAPLKARTQKSRHVETLRKAASAHAQEANSRLANDMELPGRQQAAIGKLQSTAGNQAVSRMVGGGLTIQRKVVTIEGELVEIHSSLGKVSKRGEAERAEAQKILKEFKDTYGLTVSSSKLIEGIKEQYDKVPAKV